ncbi:MAG: tRNA (guanosine(46)-N7)-methyltransferase TrmB [Tannerella sp.]|jgi:tRNA (guanine-N7-)-methyltransferase|nr:tRNA (guanosine(46)-N7)-methyltransferase TrmB [Tannerella sp.]
MGKNKLKKFAEMASFPNVYEYPFSVLEREGCELRGRWNERVFRNDNPVILELGCGRGEYTVGLGRINPDRNFIGIDIKGARMWAGAKEALENEMNNVAFLRTNIELLPRFFAAGEVSEIWLTFPDPQMKKCNKRLTSTRFISLYSAIMPDDGLVHLKTDSLFLYTYTCEMLKVNNLPVILSTDDLYSSGLAVSMPPIKTAYEQQWLDRGLTIKCLSFVCGKRERYVEPDVEIEPDSYRSFGRGKISIKN